MVKNNIYFMKYLHKYQDFLLEKVNTTNYLSKVGKAETNKYKPEVKAFLDVIAFAEGTYKFPNNGYNTQFTGKQFDSYDDHPREIISANGLDSSASGRYQFLSKTWDGVMRGKEFTPKNQDDGAVKLLKRRKSYRPLLKGDLKTALYNSRQEWASFPWSPYGQGAWFANNDEDKFKVLNDLYWRRLKQYDPNAEIPDLEDIDTDISELSAKEKNRIGSKKRNGSGYKGGDSLPLVVGESSGDNVVKLQTALVNLGASLPIYGIDGLFGSETMGTTKKVLTHIYDYMKEDVKGEVNNELSEQNFNIILKASTDVKVTTYLNANMKDEDYTDYSVNLPMVDGEITEAGNIYNAESISGFLTKMKNSEPVKIYHIGDSHIQASWLPNTIKKGLSEKSKVTYDKNATNGWTVTKHIKNGGKIQSDLKQGNYDLVIISLGGNDSYMDSNKFSANKFESRYSKLIEIIKDSDPNVEILLTTPTSSVYPLKTKNPNPNKVETQSSIYNVGSKKDVAVWDIFKKMGGVKAILKWYEAGLVSDGVHFNYKGYNKIGNMLVSDLKKYYEG